MLSASSVNTEEAKRWVMRLSDGISRSALPIVSIIAFFGVWELAAAVFQIPLWLFPKPSDFLWRLVTDYNLILMHAFATSKTLFLGFSIGVLISVPLGLVIVSFRVLERGLYPVIVFLNIMPKTIIGPIMIVWFGIGPLVSVVIVFLMCFFPVLVDSMSGFRAIDKRLFYITRSMGATSWQTFYYVKIKAALPYISAGMRIGIVSAAEGAVIAEFIGSSEGLGYLIMYASSFMNLSLMFSALVAAAIVAIFFNSAVMTLERLLTPWSPANH